jgi:hypothetical protein
MILTTGEPNVHYTMSMDRPRFPDATQVDVYVEKTLESHPKAHNILGRGTINFGKMVSDMAPLVRPEIKIIDLDGEDDDRYVVFTPEMLEASTTRGVTIDEGFVRSLRPTSLQAVRSSEFAFAAPVVTGSGLVIHTSQNDYSMTFPAIRTLEERIERAAVLRKVNEFIDPHDYETVDY